MCGGVSREPSLICRSAETPGTSSGALSSDLCIKTAPGQLLQKQGVGYAVASSPSLSLPRRSSPPALLLTDQSPTRGPENAPEAGLTLRNGGIACDASVLDSPDSSPDEDRVDIDGSESPRDPRPLASRGENSRPPDNSVCLDPGDRADKQDKQHPFSPQAIGRRPQHHRNAKHSKQQTHQQERSPAPPATASASPRAMQQDELISQGIASCEARQTSRAEISHTAPLGAEASHSPNHPAALSPPENSTSRESTSRRVSNSKSTVMTKLCRLASSGR
ncbi:hypothetical protein GQ53DRAFT_147151 [Thozetella sp. PMI_491]|nr:hypothetical protein GQ53DRAFT_147151 [Thozetella sp. PMI_491]